LVRRAASNNDAASFMSYIRGEDRNQAALLPTAIEDYVGANATVRVIDAFVDGLNVSEFVEAAGISLTTWYRNHETVSSAIWKAEPPSADETVSPYRPLAPNHHQVVDVTPASPH
jgi:hypothetical protein